MCLIALRIVSGRLAGRFKRFIYSSYSFKKEITKNYKKKQRCVRYSNDAVLTNHSGLKLPKKKLMTLRKKKKMAQRNRYRIVKNTKKKKTAKKEIQSENTGERAATSGVRFSNKISLDVSFHVGNESRRSVTRGARIDNRHELTRIHAGSLNRNYAYQWRSSNKPPFIT